MGDVDTIALVIIATLAVTISFCGLGYVGFCSRYEELDPQSVTTPELIGAQVRAQKHAPQQAAR